MTPRLPVIERDAHIVEAFHFMGPGREKITEVGSFLIPVTWSEIAAFRHETGRIAAGWEAEALAAMSKAYCREYAKAGSPLRIAPMDRGKDPDAYKFDPERSGG